MAIRKITLISRLILEQNGKLLFLSQSSKNGGKLTLVGGKVDSGEMAIDALVRETMEEIGVFVEAHNLQLIHVLQREKANETLMVMYFKAFSWIGEPYSREIKKFSHIEWHTIDALPNNISFVTKKVLRDYAAGINFTSYDERRVAMFYK